MRKPAFCICENKDADQLRSNHEADQHFCFCYTDSTIPLLSKSEISSLNASSVAVQPGLCQTWSETPKTGFLTTWLIGLFACWVILHVFVCCTFSKFCVNSVAGGLPIQGLLMRTHNFFFYGEIRRL